MLHGYFTVASLGGSPLQRRLLNCNGAVDLPLITVEAVAKAVFVSEI